MNSILTSLSAVFIMLILIGVGWVFGRVGWIKAETKGFFAKFLVNICIPCVCVSNVFTSFTRDMFDEMALLLLAALVSMVASILLAWGAAVLFKVKYNRRGTFVSIAGLSNTVFVGLPVCTALFGDGCLPYALMYYIVNSMLFWMLGYPILSHYGSNKTEGRGFWGALKKIISPPLVAIVLSLPLMYFGFKMPAFLLKAATYFSNCATPLGLVYVGYIIFESGRWEMNGSLALMTGMRFIVAPCLMLLTAWLLGVGEPARSIFTVQAAMPAMTQAVVMTTVTGGDEKFAMEGVTVTTVLCFVVIPILMLLL